jgi:hypothetical protein
MMRLEFKENLRATLYGLWWRRSRRRHGSKHTSHRHLGESIRDSGTFASTSFSPSRASSGIGEHTERHKPTMRFAAAAVQVFVYYADIVERDVCELRTYRAIATSPDARRRRLRPLLHFDLSARVDFDPRSFEADPQRVGKSFRRNQQVVPSIPACAG